MDNPINTNSKYHICFTCKTVIRKQDTARPLREFNNQDMQDYIKEKCKCSEQCSFTTEVLCNKCRMLYYKHKKKSQSTSQMSNEEEENNPINTYQAKRNPDDAHESCADSVSIHKKVKLSIPRTSSSHSKCLICDKRDTLVRITKDIRINTFVDQGIFIPVGARCCKRHIKEQNILLDDRSKMKITSNETELDPKEIKDLLSDVRAEACKKKAGLDFDDPTSLNDDDYYNLTGITKEQFGDLSDYLCNVKYSQSRSPRTCLALLLCKLRCGMSHKVLQTLFQMPSKMSVSRAMNTARKSLMTYFVPKYLGFQHISREDFIKDHTRPLVQEVLANGENVAAVVLDGTYIYIEKSANYSFQRHTFSGHKYRSLVKPMMVVGTDGYILSVLGPYLSNGKNNDASILKHMIKGNAEEMLTWLQEGDLFVVDRGFRDSIEFLESIGFRTEMPEYLSKGQKQHSTEEANHSRLVTKIRWVVESANGRIKKWKALDQVMPNSQLHCIGDHVRIVCAVCNAYRPAFVTCTHDDSELSKKLKTLALLSNTLQEKVIDEKLATKRAIWKAMEKDDLQDFPKLSEDELCDLTLSVYQIKQAKSYTQEHLTTDGKYEFSIHKEDTGLIRIKIQSRHTSSKTYLLWISYGCIGGADSITGWYCLCKAGARTVGCCAHIASVLWYLGYQRHCTDATATSINHKEHFLNAADEDWISEDDEDKGSEN